MRSFARPFLACTILFVSFGLGRGQVSYSADTSWVRKSVISSSTDVVITMSNPTSQAIIYQWERIEENLPSLWGSFFSAAGTNWSPFVSSDTFSCVPGSNDTHVNFQTNGQLGIGTVRILLYHPGDSANTSQILTYILECDTTTSGTPRLGNDFYTIFPNPVSERIWIDENGRSLYSPASYTIYDHFGAVMLSGKLSGASPIELSQLEPGIYVIEIESKANNEKVLFKFLKL